MVALFEAAQPLVTDVSSYALPMPSPVLTCSMLLPGAMVQRRGPGTCLRTRYAMSGTELACMALPGGAQYDDSRRAVRDGAGAYAYLPMLLLQHVRCDAVSLLCDVSCVMRWRGMRMSMTATGEACGCR
eukprot:1981220-Rhodomonas_salina.1